MSVAASALALVCFGPLSALFSDCSACICLCRRVHRCRRCVPLSPRAPLGRQLDPSRSRGLSGRRTHVAVPRKTPLSAAELTNLQCTQRTCVRATHLCRRERSDVPPSFADTTRCFLKKAERSPSRSVRGRACGGLLWCSLSAARATREPRRWHESASRACERRRLAVFVSTMPHQAMVVFVEAIPSQSSTYYGSVCFGAHDIRASLRFTNLKQNREKSGIRLSEETSCV